MPGTADPFETPIFVVNFNQLTHLRKQIAWLTTRGYKRLIIIDNNSTFQPLLEFYSSIKDSVEVIRLERNFGHKALWEAGIIERLNIDGPFVYTDPDIVPDDVCPSDLVEHLLALLMRFPQLRKVGPALRIDNLPDTYKFKREVLVWESQFWKRPVARGMFMAPIDTSFAVYRPHSPFILKPAVRTGWPYVARHEPWYADSSNKTEEMRFYEQTAKNSNWNIPALPAWLETSTLRMQGSQKTLLHMGCGYELMPGWIKVNSQKNVGADIVFDLNDCSKEKLPLADECVDGFFMDHVFEHIENTLPMMQELYRVAKPGAKFIARLGYEAPADAAGGPTPQRRCFLDNFVHFGQPTCSSADDGYLGGWQIERVKFVVDPDLLKSAGEIATLKLARTQPNVITEMIVELSAVKPALERKQQSLRQPEPTVSGSILDEDTNF